MFRHPMAATAALVPLQTVPPQQPAQRPPVFRAGVNYVRLDAYPTLGREIIPNLTKNDFEIYEDGKRQTVAAAEFVALDTPDDGRGWMLSAREGLEPAADPHYRVVIVVIDRAVFDLQRWQAIREELHQFLQSQAGPRDLSGVITTDRPWIDLVPGRGIQAIEDDSRRLSGCARRPAGADALLGTCGLDGLRGRIRADATCTLLQGIIKLLAQVRDDRASLVFVERLEPGDAGQAVVPAASVQDAGEDRPGQRQDPACRRVRRRYTTRCAKRKAPAPPTDVCVAFRVR